MRSSSSSNIHHPGKVNIRIDAIERILEGKYAERASFLVESFKNLQIPSIVRRAPADQGILK